MPSANFADYDQSAGMEYAPDSEDDQFTSPGSTYTVGGGKYYGLPPAAHADAQSSQDFGGASTGSYGAYGSRQDRGDLAGRSLIEANTGALSESNRKAAPLSSSQTTTLSSLANRAQLFTPDSMPRNMATRSTALSEPGYAPYNRNIGNDSSQFGQSAQIPLWDRAPTGASASNAASTAGSGGQQQGPTVITASGAVVQGPPTDAGRLALKVQTQARELNDLTHTLREREGYAHMVERRLLEIVPDHPMPVSDAHLGTVVGKLSKLARGAAEELSGGASPGKVLGVASHIVSATAAERKQARDTGNAIRNLERQLEKARRQADDAQARIKELRTAVDAKEKDRVSALRRAEGLTQKVIGLEAEMRLAGLTPSVQYTIGGGAPGADMHGAYEAESSAAGQGQSSSGRVRTLEAELLAAKAAQQSVQEELAREAAAHAQARIEIQSLQSALQRSAVDAGLPADAAGMLSTLASLRGQLTSVRAELDRRGQECSSREADVRDLTGQLRALQVKLHQAEAGASDASHAATASSGPASRPLPLGPSGIPGPSYSTPAKGKGRGGMEMGGIVVSSPTLGNITASSHTAGAGFGARGGGSGLGSSQAQPTAAMQDTFVRLEAEKGALLDYIAEIRDAYAALQAQSEMVGKERSVYAEQAKRGREQAAEAQRAAETAQATASTASRQLQDVQKQLVAASERVKELTGQYAQASAALADKAAEISELANVQQELLDMIRGLKTEMSESRVECDSLRRKVVDLQRKVESTEASLDHTEADRDHLEARVHQLLRERTEVGQQAEHAAKSQQEAASMLSQLQSERRAAEQRAAALEGTITALTQAKEQGHQRLLEAEQRTSALTAEVQTLRRIAESVQSAESDVARFLKSHGTVLQADEEQPLVLGDNVHSGPSSAGAHSRASPSRRRKPTGLNGGMSELVDPEEEDGGEEEALPGPSQGYQVTRFDGSSEAGKGAKGKKMQAADDDASAHKVVQAAANAGRKALARAEEAKVWSNDAAVNSAVPHTASAARQLAGWLRTAGAALTDTARRLSQELEDRRLQRTMCYEEIHGLRDALADARDTLLRERTRAAEAEAQLAALTHRRESEVNNLTARLTETTHERDHLRGVQENSSASLVSAREDLGRARTQTESLQSQVEGLSIARNAAVARAEELNKHLHALSVERDSLGDQAKDLGRSLSEARSHNGVLEKERADCLARMVSMDKQATEAAAQLQTLTAQLQSANARISELSSAVDAGGRDKSTLVQRAGQLTVELEGAHATMDAQNELIDHLQQQLRALGEERSALHKGMASVSGELEAVKGVVERLCAELESKLGALVTTMARQGIDTTAMLNTKPQALPQVQGLPLKAPSDPSTYTGVFAVLSKLSGHLHALSLAGQGSLARVGQLMSECGGLKQEVAAMRPRLEAVQEVVHQASDKSRALQGAEKSISELRVQLSQAESSLSAAQAEMVSLRGRIVEQAQEIERSNTRIAMLVTEGESAREAERRSAAVLSEAQGHIAGLEEEVTRMRRDADTLVAQRYVLAAGTCVSSP